MRTGWFQASIALMALTAFSRLLGYFRDTMIAYRFGASTATDAFLVAYTVPAFIVSIIGGALNSVLVPRVVAHRTQGNEARAWAIIYAALFWLVVASLVFCIGFSIVAVPLMDALAPGFPTPEKLLAASLVQVLMAYVFFSIIGFFLGAVLNAHHRFVYAAIAPSLASLAAVVALLVDAHPAIELVAWALLVGAILQVLLQAFPLLPEALRHRRRPPVRDPEMKRMGRLSGPVFLSSAVSSANIITDRLFASLLPTGSVTALAFSLRVIQVPIGVFGLAVSTVLYPRFAEALAAGDRPEFTRLLERGIRLVVLLTFPLTAALLALSGPLIDVLFRHGAFTQAASSLTALCLDGFAISLIPSSLLLLLTRAYFTFEATSFVGIVSTFTLVLNAVADYVGAKYLAAPGIAIATVLVTGAFMVVLVAGLKRHLPDFTPAGVARSALPVAVASALGGVAAALIARGVRSVTFPGAILSGGVGLIACFAVASLVALAINVPEARLVWRRLVTRLMPT